MLIRWNSMRSVFQNTFIAFAVEFDDKKCTNEQYNKNYIFHY